MIKKIIIIFLSVLFIPTLAFSNSNKFIKFVDRFAQNPFELEEEEFYIGSLSKSELRTLRNAIFALHGYVFDSKDLKTFFLSRQWYNPISKNITLSDIDKKNINFISKFENPEEINFIDFLAHFQEKSLPITITDEKYGNSYARHIPIYYIKKYYNICCPEIQALDKINVNNQLILVTYRILWAGVSFGIITFTFSGELVGHERVARYHGDIGGGVISNSKIDKDLHIFIENKYYNFNEDISMNGEKGLKKIEIEKYYIDKNGLIKKN